MFGLGLTEVLIFLIVGFIVFGIPIAIVLLLVSLLRKPQNGINESPQVSQLREENERLRRELELSKIEKPRSSS